MTSRSLLQQKFVGMAVAVMVVSGLFVVGAPAGAAPAYPPQLDTIVVDNPAPAAGASFTVSVACAGSETVIFGFEGSTQTVTCQPAGDGGVATASFSAPPQAGSFTVTATFPATGLELTAIVVVAPTPGATTIPAAGGGAASGDVIRVAVGLLVVGGGLAAVAGRRRRPALI